MSNSLASTNTLPIIRCRTSVMGGQAFHSPDCGKNVYVYRGCRNRHCPACHADQTRKWLDAKQAEMLPCEYFHVTHTVPEEKRAVCRSNQKDCYGILMHIAAEAVITLCRDKRHIEATPAILAVLHTWTGSMDYHSHVHMLVSAGGISPDGKRWIDAKPGFLIPVKALSRFFRNRMRLERKNESMQNSVTKTKSATQKQNFNSSPTSQISP